MASRLPHTTQDFLGFLQDDANGFEPATSATVDLVLQRELEALFDFHFYGQVDSTTLDVDDENGLETQRSSDFSETFDSLNDVSIPNAVDPSKKSDMSTQCFTPPHSLRKSRTSKKMAGASPPKRKRRRQDTFSDEESDAPKSRHHRKGYNASTGELTIVGQFPPLIRGGRFICPEPQCRRNGEEYSYNSQNGYKYHLKNGCVQTMHLRLAQRECSEDYEKRRKVSKTNKCGKCIRGGNKGVEMNSQGVQTLNRIFLEEEPSSQILAGLVDPQLTLGDVSRYLVSECDEFED